MAVAATCRLALIHAPSEALVECLIVFGDRRRPPYRFWRVAIPTFLLGLGYTFRFHMLARERAPRALGRGNR